MNIMNLTCNQYGNTSFYMNYVGIVTVWPIINLPGC